MADGKIFGDLGFDGYPSAVALYEGKILWKGHPNGISKAFLYGLSQGRLEEF